MTMHRIELMEAAMADMDNQTAAEVLRVMVQNVAFVHRVSGPECLTVEEFQVAVSRVPEAARTYDAIRAQAWDQEHVDAYVAKHGLRPSARTGRQRLAEDRELVRRHMNGESVHA